MNKPVECIHERQRIIYDDDSTYWECLDCGEGGEL